MLDNYTLSKINDIIINLHKHNDISSMCEDLLSTLSSVIPFRLGIIGICPIIKNQLTEFENVFISSPDNSFNNNLLEDLREYSKYDYLNWLYSSSESIVYKDSDLVNSKLRTNSIYYNDFLKKNDLLNACGILIMNDHRPMASIALYNGASADDFTDNDIFVLDYLRPHLEMAFDTYSKQLSEQNHYLNILKNNLNLTDREIEIVKYIIDGDTNNEIAKKLYIQTNTIKKHIYNIYNKLGVSSRTQLLQLISNKNLLGIFKSL